VSGKQFVESCGSDVAFSVLHGTGGAIGCGLPADAASEADICLRMNDAGGAIGKPTKC